jgi:hypothetical protein
VSRTSTPSMPLASASCTVPEWRGPFDGGQRSRNWAICCASEVEQCYLRRGAGPSRGARWSRRGGRPGVGCRRVPGCRRPRVPSRSAAPVSRGRELHLGRHGRRSSGRACGSGGSWCRQLFGHSVRGCAVLGGDPVGFQNRAYVAVPRSGTPQAATCSRRRSAGLGGLGSGRRPAVCVQCASHHPAPVTSTDAKPVPSLVRHEVQVCRLIPPENGHHHSRRT